MQGASGPRGRDGKIFFRVMQKYPPRFVLPCICPMEKQKNNPLPGMTLEMILNHLVDRYGWEELGQRIRINCFISNPGIKSSLVFLRNTPGPGKKWGNCI